MTHLTGSEVNASGSVLPNPITSGTGGNSANYGSKLVGGKKSKKAKKSMRKTRKNKGIKDNCDKNINRLKRIMNPNKRLLLPFAAIFGYKH